MSAAPRLRACILITAGGQQEVLFLYPPVRFIQFVLRDPAGARAALAAMNHADQARQLRACLRWTAWYGAQLGVAPGQLQALLHDEA